MVILPLKTSEKYRVHLSSWDVEKGHQPMHYIRQQIFRRPPVCSTWDCSKLRLGQMRLLILQGVQVFHVIQFYILNNAKVDTKRMNNWMVQKPTSISIGDYTGLLLVFSGIAGCSGLLMIHDETWWTILKLEFDRYEIPIDVFIGLVHILFQLFCFLFFGKISVSDVFQFHVQTFMTIAKGIFHNSAKKSRKCSCQRIVCGFGKWQILGYSGNGVMEVTSLFSQDFLSQAV